MKTASLLFIAFICLGCEKDDPPTAPTTYAVEYTVTGTAANVSVTYALADGGTSQIGDTPTPWSYEFRAVKGTFVYVSAQNQTETGTVTATILRDGREFKTATSTGAYVIATSSGSL